MAKVNRVGRSFSTLPFDGIDNVHNVFLHDDFITVADVADVGADTSVQSELLWNADETVVTTGPATVALVAGEDGHPGIVRLSNGGAAGDAVTLALGGAVAAEADGQIILDSNGIYVASMIRIADVDAANVEFGLVGQAAEAPNSSAVDLVSFVWENADTAGQFIAQVNSDGTDVEEAFTIGYTESDWAQLELYATDTDAYFRLTTEDGQETINLTPAAMPLVALRPIFTVENVGGAAETLDIDAFHLRYNRPEEAANAGISWLGA